MVGMLIRGQGINTFTSYKHCSLPPHSLMVHPSTSHCLVQNLKFVLCWHPVILIRQTVIILLTIFNRRRSAYSCKVDIICSPRWANFKIAQSLCIPVKNVSSQRAHWHLTSKLRESTFWGYLVSSECRGERGTLDVWVRWAALNIFFMPKAISSWLILIMNSMQTCNSVTFYFLKKLIFWYWWY